MTHEFDNSGNLILIAGENEKELLEERKNEQDFHSNETMSEIMESFIGNSGFQFVAPESIGALTDAPILGEMNEKEEFDTVYAFMDYQIRSVQQDLLEYGRAVFIKC